MKRELDRRVVVTGMGTINPVGTGTEATWQALASGRSGIGPITLFDASSLPVRIAGQVKDFDASAVFGKRRARHLDRFTQLALVATREAIEASKLNLDSLDRTRIGTTYASGVGGIGTTEEGTRIMLDRGPEWLSPYMCPMMLPNMAAGEVAIEFGLQGPSSCTVTACAASAMALGDGYDQIILGRADAMVCGGSEAGITPLGLAGFSAMKALSVRNDDPAGASRPFDRGRDGFVAAEGAATVVLEEREFALARGAPILAELVGFGTTSDAHHVTAPHPEGDGAVRAMRMALADAGLEPADIGYINAHGTSTPPNDRIETAAVKQVFGSTVPLSSTKSMTGHLLGAAGALEALVCVKAILSGVLPPTINYEDPDPACDLDYVPNTARTVSIGAAMSNSFGFGGHNITLIFTRP